MSPLRKSTLRKLPPATRDLAKLIGELESITRRLKNRLPLFEQLEREALALRAARPKPPKEPA